MTTFDFANLHVDVDRPRDAIDTLLHVVGTFSVKIDGAEFFREDEFPVVELAAQLEYWLKRRKDDAFAFQSLEYEDVLLSFKPEGSCWRLLSDWRDQPSDCFLSSDELRLAVQSYVDGIKREVKKKLNIDVTPAFRLRR